MYPGPPGPGASIGNMESCPRCGEMAHIEDAIQGASMGFRFLGHARSAFAASNVVELQAFQAVAKAAATGDKTVEAAARDAAQVRSTFASLLIVAKEWGLIHLLVAALGIYIQWLIAQEGGDRSTEKLLNELQRGNDIAAEALDELKRLDPSPSMQAPGDIAPPTLPPIQRTSIAHGQPNRHARRSARSSKRPRGPARL